MVGSVAAVGAVGGVWEQQLAAVAEDVLQGAVAHAVGVEPAAARGAPSLPAAGPHTSSQPWTFRIAARCRGLQSAAAESVGATAARRGSQAIAEAAALRVVPPQPVPVPHPPFPHSPKGMTYVGVAGRGVIRVRAGATGGAAGRLQSDRSATHLTLPPTVPFPSTHSVIVPPMPARTVPPSGRRLVAPPTETAAAPVGSAAAWPQRRSQPRASARSSHAAAAAPASTGARCDPQFALLQAEQQGSKVATRVKTRRRCFGEVVSKET